MYPSDRHDRRPVVRRETATPSVSSVGIELGLTGTVTMVVTEADTALVYGTGEVLVLSTPRLLQLMQQATMKALEGHLPVGMITAGLRVNLDHLHGSEVGAEVSATATLTRIEGRRLIFEADATSHETIVGTGRIIRVQIDKERFLSRIA